MERKRDRVRRADRGLPVRSVDAQLDEDASHGRRAARPRGRATYAKGAGRSRYFAGKFTSTSAVAPRATSTSFVTTPPPESLTETT